MQSVTYFYKEEKLWSSSHSAIRLNLKINHYNVPDQPILFRNQIWKSHQIKSVYGN